MSVYGYHIKLEDGFYVLRYRDMPILYRTRWHWVAKLLLSYRLLKIEWFMFATIHRTNRYWIRKRFRQIKEYLHRPVCWIKNHQSYDCGSWGYSATKCSRCQKLLTYKKYR